MTEPSTTSKPISTNNPAPTDHAAEDLKAAVVTGAHDVKDGLANLADDAVKQTKKGAESQLTSGKERASDGLRDVAKALRSASKQMSEDDNHALTGYIDSAASKVSDASDYLKDHSLADLSTDLKSFARREPALFLGGALVLGLLGGRFLKSSAPESAATGPQGGRDRAVPAPRLPMRAAPNSARFYPTTSRSGMLGPSPSGEPGRAVTSSTSTTRPMLRPDTKNGSGVA